MSAQSGGHNRYIGELATTFIGIWFLYRHRACIKSQSANPLSPLETGSTDTIKLDDEFKKMLVSSIDEGRGRSNDNHDENSDLLWIFQQCDETSRPVSSALPELAFIFHATTTQMAKEETPASGGFLQAQALDLERQAAAQTVVLPASLFTYDHNRVLVWQAAMEWSLQHYVSVPLRARIMFLSHYLTIAGQPRNRLVYDTIRNHFSWPQAPTTYIRQWSIECISNDV